MDTIVSFLMSETGLTLLAWIIGSLISALFSYEKILKFLDESKKKKLRTALDYLEASVLKQRDQVEKMKTESGGSLTEAQKKELENNVIENLKETAKNTGVDAVKIIGPDLVQVAIVQAVKKLKSSVPIVNTPQLPSSVKSLFENK